MLNRLHLNQETQIGCKYLEARVFYLFFFCFLVSGCIVSEFVWVLFPSLYSADMSPIWRLMTSLLSQIHSTSTREKRGAARCPQYRSYMQIPPVVEQIVLRESPTGWTQPRPTYIVFSSHTHTYTHATPVTHREIGHLASSIPQTHDPAV